MPDPAHRLDSAQPTLAAAPAASSASSASSPAQSAAGAPASPFATPGRSRKAGADPLSKLGTGMVLLGFGASWCAPWQLLEATLAALAGDGVDVRKVDIDQWPAHAETYRVISVPTFVLVKNGKEVRRRIGATGARELRKLIGRR